MSAQHNYRPDCGRTSETTEGEIYTTDDINNGDFPTGNISVDPQFMDAATPDVHLQSGSPCIDAGIDVGLPYLGAAPDVGAFEFAASQVYLPLLAN